MGDVAVILKVMPVSPEVDLGKVREEIKKSIPSYAKLRAIQEKPIAFGISALIVATIQSDKVGGTEETERAIAQIEGVESVEVEEVGLI